MELPDLEVANELKADMSNFESMWGLYEQFNNGLQELAKEDWISFRFLGLLECYFIIQSIFIFIIYRENKKTWFFSDTHVTAMKLCSYRSKAYMFEEFLSSWYEKLKSEEPTTMTVRLQKDIDKYKVQCNLMLISFCIALHIKIRPLERYGK